MHRWTGVSLYEANQVEGGGNNWIFAGVGLFLVAAYWAQLIYFRLQGR